MTTLPHATARFCPCIFLARAPMSIDLNSSTAPARCYRLRAASHQAWTSTSALVILPSLPGLRGGPISSGHRVATASPGRAPSKSTDARLILPVLVPGAQPKLSHGSPSTSEGTWPGWDAQHKLVSPPAGGGWKGTTRPVKDGRAFVLAR